MRANPDPSRPGNTLVGGDTDTPFKGGRLTLTQDEYNGVKAFLRELKPGVYFKCSRCERMKTSATIMFPNGGDPYCEGCE